MTSSSFPQRDLAIAMSDACLSYFENAIVMYKAIEYTEKGKGHMILNNLTRGSIKLFKLIALESLALTDYDRIQEGIQVGEEMIVLFDQIVDWSENDPHVKGCKANLSTSLEVDTCQYLARLYTMVRSPENDKKVIIYSERAIRVCKGTGNDEKAKQMERVLENERLKFSRKFEGIREEIEYAQAEATVLPEGREFYNTVITKQG